MITVGGGLAAFQVNHRLPELVDPAYCAAAGTLRWLEWKIACCSSPWRSFAQGSENHVVSNWSEPGIVLSAVHRAQAHVDAQPRQIGSG